MKRVYFLIILVFILSSCTVQSQLTINPKPEDVRQEIWDNGLKYSRLIDYYTEHKETFPEGFAEGYTNAFINKGNTTPTETKIILTTTSLFEEYLNTAYWGKEPSKEYNQFFNDLESIYGKGSLDSSNVTKDDLTNIQIDSLIAKEESKTKVIDDYMKKNNITLTAKDVQYDMKNNLDKNFAIVGTAELDDYYNYGFDERMEKDYFVAFVIPEGSSYSEGWYLYFHRDSFDKLFRELKDGNRNIMATCQIPKWRYKDGQNNMAIVESVSW